MKKAPDMRNTGLLKEAKSALQKIQKYKEDYNPTDVAPKLKSDKNASDVSSEYNETEAD